MPGIYQVYIYHVYIWYRHVMYEAVIMLIAFLSFLPAGFRGQHFAVPSGGSSPLDIPRPDPNDDEDNLQSSTKDDMCKAARRPTINLLFRRHC